MLIGISGKIGAGKDTVADLIVKHHSKPCDIRRFADRLKHTVAALTQTSVEENYTRPGKQKVPPGFAPLTLGELQQKVGMALRQHVDPHVWIKATLHDVPVATNPRIISDVRFVNEAEAIRAFGGVMIRVNGDPTGCRKTDARNLEHVSETELDHWPHFDWVVENDGTLEELDHKVRAFLSSLGEENFIAQ